MDAAPSAPEPGKLQHGHACLEMHFGSCVRLVSVFVQVQEAFLFESEVLVPKSGL